MQRAAFWKDYSVQASKRRDVYLLDSQGPKKLKREIRKEGWAIFRSCAAGRVILRSLGGAPPLLKSRFQQGRMLRFAGPTY